jgi:hypothetical protein
MNIVAPPPEKGFSESDGSRHSERVDAIFDDIAQIVASNIPRRKALKLVLTGFLAAALAEIGVESAWAARTCVCAGQLYDPTTSCCTSSGVQPKHPMKDLATCPNKVPHPGYTPTLDGCTNVPDSWGAANFTPGCNNHDRCYQTCNSDKNACDNALHTDLNQACNAAYPGSDARSQIKLKGCLSASSTYFFGVQKAGGSFYRADQILACDCCATSDCPQPCAGGTCGGAPSCGDDSSCVCFKSVEGNGFCHRSQPCAGLSPCSSSAECPAGWICSNITCCGSGAICIRPCTVISGSSPESVPTEPSTTGPLPSN